MRMMTAAPAPIESRPNKAFLEIIHAVWAHIARNGGDAVRGWRGRNSVSADLAYWNRGTFAEDEAMPAVGIFICSAAADRAEVEARARAFARLGATESWLVDVEARTIAVFEASGWVGEIKQGVLSTEAAPSLTVDLALLLE